MLNCFINKYLACKLLSISATDLESASNSTHVAHAAESHK